MQRTLTPRCHQQGTGVKGWGIHFWSASHSPSWYCSLSTHHKYSSPFINSCVCPLLVSIFETVFSAFSVLPLHFFTFLHSLEPAASAAWMAPSWHSPQMLTSPPLLPQPPDPAPKPRAAHAPLLPRQLPASDGVLLGLKNRVGTQREETHTKIHIYIYTCM